MEIRRYLKILRDHWILVAVCFSLTLGLTIAFVAQQPWVYQSGGTLIVRPRASTADEIVQAFNTLNRGVEINSTYAAIARSDLVRDRAAEQVGQSKGGIRVNSDVVTGTNMIRISVESTDPDKSFAFAQAIGAETVAYVDALHDAYELQPLDPPQAPNSPSGPNKPLTIVIGAVFGFLLGWVLAFLVDYFSRAAGRKTSFEILDPVSGMFNADYFQLRMREEIARLDGAPSTFSVGILKLEDLEDEDRPVEGATIRAVGDLLSEALRPQDVLCATEPRTLSTIFPEVDGNACRRLLEDWVASIETMQLARPLHVEIEVREYTSTDSHRLESVPSDAVEA